VREGGAKYNSEVHIRQIAVICVLLSGIGAAAQVGTDWRDAPEYLPLLAPAGSAGAAYRVFTSPLDIDAALQRLEGDTSLVRIPGAWQARPTLPLDAFGQAGRYDRSGMARVYGGRQPRVARGARSVDRRVIESWTLIAPYPDTELRRLEAGTLLIVLRLP
jgi:hypothetical protein